MRLYDDESSPKSFTREWILFRSKFYLILIVSLAIGFSPFASRPIVSYLCMTRLVLILRILLMILPTGNFIVSCSGMHRIRWSKYSLTRAVDPGLIHRWIDTRLLALRIAIPI